MIMAMGTATIMGTINITVMTTIMGTHTTMTTIMITGISMITLQPATITRPIRTRPIARGHGR